MMARFDGILSSHKKALSKLDPLWKIFLDPCMIINLLKRVDFLSYKRTNLFVTCYSVIVKVLRPGDLSSTSLL